MIHISRQNNNIYMATEEQRNVDQFAVILCCQKLFDKCMKEKLTQNPESNKFPSCSQDFRKCISIYNKTNFN